MKLSLGCVPILAFVALSLSCHVDAPARDAAARHEAPPSAGCDPACYNARKWCGETELEAADGSACEKVCENAEQNGIDFHTRCLARATTCDAVHACVR